MEYGIYNLETGRVVSLYVGRLPNEQIVEGQGIAPWPKGFAQRDLIRVGDQWSPAPAAPAPVITPSFLPRLRFWTYLATLGVSRGMVLSEIEAAASAGALTPIEAEIARLKVSDAENYERLDPLILDLGQMLGIAQTQAHIDAHFRAAAAMTL